MATPPCSIVCHASGLLLPTRYFCPDLSSIPIYLASNAGNSALAHFTPTTSTVANNFPPPLL